MITLNELQKEVKIWADRNFGTDRNHLHPLLGVAEEVGELNHAILKMEQGIRGSKSKHYVEAKDAIGDIIVFLADFCAQNGFDLQECVDMAWNTASKRDWTKSVSKGDADNKEVKR